MSRNKMFRYLRKGFIPFGIEEFNAKKFAEDLRIYKIKSNSGKTEYWAIENVFCDFFAKVLTTHTSEFVEYIIENEGYIQLADGRKTRIVYNDDVSKKYYEIKIMKS